MRSPHTPLTKGERVHLARIARDAHQRLTAAGALDEPFDAWRHRQSLAAVGKRISEATVGDFDPLKAHFLAQIGQTGKALNLILGQSASKLKEAQYHLAAALSQAGLDTAYAEHICRCKYKCGLKQATAKQLWTLTYDVRRNARAHAKRPTPTAV